jgi:hypothetical protein
MPHTNLRSKPRSKREQIWQLVSEGNLTPKAIALRLGTTVENVWKETSLLRSREGLVISRSTQRLNRKNEMVLINPSEEQKDMQMIASRGTNRDYSIDIPPIDSVGLKTMYREFRSGKKPVEILAEYGLHPDTVEIEYQRFMQQSERDSDELVRGIILNITSKGYENSPVKNGKIKSLIDLYRRRGYLSNTEILSLLALYTEEEVQEGIDLMAIDIRVKPPKGFSRIRCRNCKEEFIEAILCDRLPIGKKLLAEYDEKIICDACTENLNNLESS